MAFIPVKLKSPKSNYHKLGRAILMQVFCKSKVAWVTCKCLTLLPETPGIGVAFFHKIWNFGPLSPFSPILAGPGFVIGKLLLSHQCGALYLCHVLQLLCLEYLGPLFLKDTDQQAPCFSQLYIVLIWLHIVKYKKKIKFKTHSIHLPETSNL